MMKLKQQILLVATFLSVVACSPKLGTYYSTETDVVEVDSSVTPDDEVQQIINPYKEKLDAAMNVVIAHADKTLNKGKVESELGNFMADLLQEKATEAWGKPVDMGAITIGGIRAPIREGNITVGHIYELMPFENELYVLELEAEQIRKLFNYLAQARNIAISNSVAVLKENKIKNIYIDGYQFDPSRTYTLAISDYLANGGDSMAFLKDAKKVHKLDVKIREMIMEYVKELEQEGQPVNASIEGRVKIIQ